MQGIPSDFRWSFSKLTSFDNCPMSFKLTYIDKVPQVQNAFSQYGTLAHTILEEFARGTLDKYQLASEYEKRYYSEVTLQFPPYPKGFAMKAYNQGYEYFTKFDGFGDEWEIVSTEEKFETKISGYIFSGIADLVLKNKVTGKYKVVDHKTKSGASMKREFEIYKKQLYVYARYVYEKFGEYPETMSFNMIKSDEPMEVVFDINEYNDTLLWVVSTIEEIILEFEWRVSPSPYFCQFICGVKHSCPAYDAASTFTKSKSP